MFMPSSRFDAAILDFVLPDVSSLSQAQVRDLCHASVESASDVGRPSKLKTSLTSSLPLLGMALRTMTLAFVYLVYFAVEGVVAARRDKERVPDSVGPRPARVLESSKYPMLDVLESLEHTWVHFLTRMQENQWTLHVQEHVPMASS